jgi:hypothetical protein
MDLHLIVEGGRINPDIHEDVARFMLPASAGDIVLVSETWTPRHWGGQDGRCLGVSITGFHVSDGLTCSRDIPVDDPALADDFLPEEAADGAGWRWTNGRLRIPSSFWADCRSHVFLRVLFEPGQRWLPPVTASTISRSEVA